MKHVDGFYYDGARITAQEGTTKYAEDINHKVSLTLKSPEKPYGSQYHTKHNLTLIIILFCFRLPVVSGITSGRSERTYSSSTQISRVPTTPEL